MFQIVFSTDISLECGKSLLEFMYSGELKLNKSNVRLLLHSATQLEISSAVDVCKEYIKNVQCISQSVN